jgi:hypothetical protein
MPTFTGSPQWTIAALRRSSDSNTSRAACRARIRTSARSTSSPVASIDPVAARRTTGGTRRARLRRLRPRSAMIRLPMLNVDSRFVAFVMAMNGRHFECGSERVEIGFERGRCVRRSDRASSWPARSDQTVGIRKLSERGSRASFRSAPHRTMWRACRVARARCFEHTPRRECCQRRSNLDHRANARSSGAQAGSTPAGRAERTVEAQRRALTPPSTA